ncbi:MAG TPA: lamin tail domain-containing protein, partial [Kofleriaceae bacterium]|nr:lamin tail domain-containing protein [Kofleriaceae bacterium]
CDGFDSGAGKDHIWKFTIAATSDVQLYTNDTTVFDSVLRVQTAPCDVTSEVPEYTGADGCSDAEGAAEFLAYTALPAGTYYVVLDGYLATDEGAYSFTVDATPTTCGNGTLEYEFCDDGNTMDGDGCNSKCEVEDGYVCDASEPSVCTQDPGTGTAVAPSPGDLVINEYMAADNASDTNCDGKTTGTDDEFVELVNVSSKTLDMTGVTVADSVIVRHVFGAKTVAPGKAIVVWNNGTPMCTGVGPEMWEIASTGQLGLNDAGDTITVATADATPVTLATLTYTTATANVSNNLSPDVTGTTYALHNAVSGAVGDYSPGKKANGTAF